ncbi:MAG: hypothetical protein DI582_03020 [Azospirillum brasilense]|nr:MAG: hypothetical protein DI582_03020 [Azospirillum brasilense]
MSRAFLQRFLHDEGGASIVEFAIVAPIFFMLFLGIMEFGLFMFHKIAVEAITLQAARESSLGKTMGGNCASTKTRVEYMECYVKDKSKSLVRGGGTEVEINTLAKGGTIEPDICMDGGKYTSKPITCTSYEDVNGNGTYEGLAAADDLGDASTLVEVRVVYPWKALVTPYIGQFFGSDDKKGGTTGVAMITASTIIRNEPF